MQACLFSLFLSLFICEICEKYGRKCFWIQKNLYLCCIQLKACFKYTLKQMLIIGIAGGTGSGKTTVVRKIIESLPAGEVVLLPQDSYYKDSSHVPVEERQNINFDHPDAFEWSLLSRHVAMLREEKA